MSSPLARYLGAAPPAPNPPRAPHALPEPRVVRDRRGWLDWDRTLTPLSAHVAALGAPELGQGFGRLLAVCAETLDAPPPFGAVIDALEHGDQNSADYVAERLAPTLWEATGERWRYALVRQRPQPQTGADPAAEDPLPHTHGPHPRAWLVQGTLDAVGAWWARFKTHDLYRAEAAGKANCALPHFCSVLMDRRPDLSAVEVLGLVHRLLDPAARQGAPEGLWAEARRSGGTVRVTYGRGGAPLLTAEYAVFNWYVLGQPPTRSNRLMKFDVVRGAQPTEVDERGAVADLVRRGVRDAATAILSSGPARVRDALLGAGFSLDRGDLSPGAARALLVAHPRSWR